MVELLSPAGEYNSFLGAVSAGADAVYLAGNMYGARASAVNFQTEEIIKALRLAHMLNKKIYLTVNTLTKNEELSKLYDFLNPLYEAGLDGVIVQDIGVIEYLKEYFKDMEIHISTQSVITSKEGALFFKNLGADRVVLARELTLNEVKDINTLGIDTECFIHGAMCYFYSGMCLFSSVLGGNSGNRGRCKGPCRQPYSFEGKEAYYLSLSDMCTIDIIPELIDAGIKSFKIEGRLKSPSYAAGVTSVYRKYIDMYLENPSSYKVSEEDRNLLKTLYSRASSGKGYYERLHSKKMITIQKGAYLKVDEDVEKEIVEKYIDNPVKLPIDFSFTGNAGDKAYLNSSLNCNSKEYNAFVSSDDNLEAASKKATDEKDIEKQLKKLGNTVFYPESIDIQTDNAFIPVSLLNDLRRKSVALLEEEFDKDFRRDKALEGLKSFEVTKNKTSHFRAFVDSKEQFYLCNESDIYDSVCLTDTLAFNEGKDLINKANKDVYIEFPQVFRSQLKEVFDYLIALSSENDIVKGIYVNQYDAYEYVKEKSFLKKINGDLNIYNYNDYSCDFNSNVFDEICAPTELSMKDISDLKHKNLSMLLYGRIPVGKSANCILNTNDKCTKYSEKDAFSYTSIKDRFGVSFPVKLNCYKGICFNTLYNSVPTSIHKYFDKLNKEGYSFDVRFTDEKKEALTEVNSFFEGLVNGVLDNPKFEFSAFYAKSGIN